MAVADLLLSQLLTRRDPTVDVALAAALPTAELPAADRMARALLERGTPDGRRQVIRQLHRLSEPQRREVAGRSGQLEHAIRKAAGDGGPAADNALWLVEQAGLAGLADVVVQLLRHDDAAVADRAADVLQGLADTAIAPEKGVRPLFQGSGGVGSASGPARQPGVQGESDAAGEREAKATLLLQQAVEKAVVQFDRHPHPRLLPAALTLARRGLPLAAKALRGGSGAAVVAMRAAVEGWDERVAGAAGWLLARPAVAAETLGLVRRAVQSGRLEAVLADRHLLRVPAVRVVLRRVGEPGHCAGSASAVVSWPADRQVAWVHWLGMLPLDDASRVERLSVLARSGAPAGRLAAVRALCKQRELLKQEGADGEAVRGVLRKSAEDPDPVVARLALRALLLYDGPNLATTLARLAGSGGPAVRALAQRRLAPIGFARLWGGWSTMGPDKRVAVGQALLKIDSRMHEKLAARLMMPDRRARVQAVAMADRLGLAGRLTEPLAQLTRQGDSVVASAAVRALAGVAVEGSAGLDAVWACVEHEDPRVRSNTLEALAERPAADPGDVHGGAARHDERRLNELIVRWVRREHHRPRAAALRALWARDAAAGLTQARVMLGDGRPEHRRAALWGGVRGGGGAKRGHFSTPPQIDPKRAKRAVSVAPPFLGHFHQVSCIKGLFGQEGSKRGHFWTPFWAKSA